MDSSIYLGAWTNWMNQTWSDVLIAAIALLITFTSVQLWGIVCFLAFRFRQSPVGDHVYHLVQAALRNSSSSPASSGLRLLEISWAQRAQSLPPSFQPATTGLMEGFNNHYYGHPGYTHGEGGGEHLHKRERTTGKFGSTLARVSFLLVLAAAVWATSMTISLLGAGFFKAADNSGLITSRACGWPVEVSNLSDVATPEAKDTSALLMVPSRARYQTARSYVRSCYAETGDAELSNQCNSLVAPRISSTLTMVEACPFPGEGVCKTGAARVESGLIDSRDVLGINTPDEDRIAVKKSLTCAPVDADQWATEWLRGDEYGAVVGDLLKGYAVGTVPWEKPPRSEYPFVATLYAVSFATEPYTLTWQTSMPGNDSRGASSFVPRDELQVSDADLTLMALSPISFFDEEIPDPWFNITVHDTSAGFGESWFAPHGYSVLGCLEQYQFCASGSCSKPAALYQTRASPSYGLRSLTRSQTAVADLVWKSLWAAQLQYGMLFMGNRILVANELIMGNWYMRSSTMPSNQWATEVWNLANISFAVIQRRPGDYASPAPILQEDARRIVRPDTDAGRALCGQIKIRTTRNTSFRILSLALLPAASALLAALNWLLPYYFSRSSSHGREANRTVDWERYNIYHLVRAVCEARGLGPWDRLEKTVPTPRERHRKFAL